MLRTGPFVEVAWSCLKSDGKAAPPMNNPDARFAYEAAQSRDSDPFHSVLLLSRQPKRSTVRSVAELRSWRTGPLDYGRVAVSEATGR